MTFLQEIAAGTLPATLTVDEVYALSEAGVFRDDDHFELVDGEIVPMAAAKADWHSIWQSRLNRVFVRSIPEDTRLFVEASVTLADDVLVEPDLAVWRKGGRPRAMRGPDLLLVIEVSDSSIAYDLRVKAPLYARFGVREYWVVDAVRETVRVHRAPFSSGYGDVREYRADERVEALLLDGVGFRLADLD